MTDPEHALERAREAAARARAEGRNPGYRPGPLEATFTGDVPSLELMSDWASIESDSEVLYSTRLGRPATALKRLLLRLLRQYNQDIEAQQTRFNMAVLARLTEIEERLAQLEDRPGASGQDPRE